MEQVSDENGLLAIGLDSSEEDTDATNANSAEETNHHDSRTFQSESDFLQQKSAYTAKIDNGDILSELYKAVPALGSSTCNDADIGGVELKKKDLQLLGYAIGEMYFDARYEEILELLTRVDERVCETGKGNGGLKERVGKWKERCERKVAIQRESGG